MKEGTEIVGTFGKWYDSVTINGRPLEVGPSLGLTNHSPTGFSWGYNGSGPAQLALAILLELSGSEDFALTWYQDFKRDYVAKFPRNWSLPVADVLEWMTHRGWEGRKYG